MTILVIILIVSICILCVTLAILKYNYDRLYKEYCEHKRKTLKVANNMSMVEYYIRNYKEGQNIYTVFRDISNIIYNSRNEEE